MINIFDTSIGSDFDTMLNCVGKDIKLNNVSMKAILNNTDDIEDTKMMKLKESINRGDIIEYNNQKFICLGEVNDKRYKTFNRVKIQKLSHIVKVTVNKKEHDIPVIIESMVQGVNSNNYMEWIKGSIRFTMQDNNVTEKISYGKIIECMGASYKVTAFTTENKGLRYIYLEKELNEHSYSIELSDKTLNLKVGDTKTISVVTKDGGVPVNLPYTLQSSDESIAKVNNNGVMNCLKEGQVTITAILTQDTRIISSCDLTIKSVEQIEYKFTPDTNTLIFGMSRNYMCNKFISSIQQSDTFTFKLNLNSKDPKICTMEIIDGNTIKLTANKKERISGTIKLEAYDSNNTMVASKDITIRFN